MNSPLVSSCSSPPSHHFTSLISLSSPPLVVSHFFPLTKRPPENFISDQSKSFFCDSKSDSLPLTTLSNLYSSSFRNRCFWKIRGTISFLREIEIYQRCSFCCHPLISLATDMRTKGQDGHLSCCHHCHHTHSHLKSSTSPISIWWKCVAVIDDGTSEVNICIEGPHAISFLESIFQEHESCCQRKYANTKQQIPKRITFGNLRRLIEEILSKYSLQLNSQHLFCSMDAPEITSSSSSSSLSSTLQPVISPICLCDRYHQLLTTFHSSSSSVTSSAQYYSNELFSLLHNFMSHCSYSALYEMTIKLIHSKNSILNRSSPDRSGPLSKDSHFDSENPLRRYRKVEKKVYLQKLNEPYWTIENIEYLSESFESLRLQCYDLKVLSNEEISEIAWKVIQNQGAN
jgi:hypothetical protein